MLRPLRVLIVEDNSADTDLLLRELRRAGFDPEWSRVDSEAAFLASLNSGLEVILSDYEMPEFGGLRALELLQESGLAIPFIIISGTIGEDTAVAAMKRGALDYLLKDRLTRLEPAISYALKQSEARRQRKEAEAALRESEERFRQMAENIQEVFWLTDVMKHQMLYVSPAYEQIWGRSCPDLYASQQPWLDAVHPEDCERVLHAATSKQTEGTYDEDYRIVRPDGTIRWINDRAFPIRNADGVVHRVAGVARDITARKESEAELKLFRSLVDQSADTFEVVDPATGRFLDVNETGLAQVGCSREEFLATRVWDLDPFVTEATWPQLAERIRTTGFLSAEGIRPRKDGTTFPIELTAKWVQLDRGYIVAVIRDITVRKQAEAELRLFRTLVDQSVDTFEVIDPATARFLDVNETGLVQKGYTREEFLALRVFDIDPSTTEATWPQLTEKIRTTGFFSGEGIHRRKDGTMFPVEVNAKWVQLDRSYIVAVIRDIATRRRTEEHIREQAQMLDEAHDAIIVRDFHTRQITFWNPGAERLYGWNAAEAMGRDMGELIYVDRNARNAADEQLLRVGTWQGDLRHVSKAGKKLIVSSSITLVRDVEGRPKSALIINIDMTEQKDLEAQFLRAQRMESIGTLASGLAHDLNNILAPILMSAPLLRLNLSADQREGLINAVESSAARGAEIVKQVLTFGRGLESEKKLLEVGPLIDEITKIIRQTFPKDIVIESSLAPGLWPVNADATQLHQVLLNLCVNARDAMPNGGKLWLRAGNLDLDAAYASAAPEATPGPHVLLEVSDTGSGIPPEVVERMFEPFFTTKGIGKGTGLGLSTVHGIVKNHGGFITVTSQPGQGTTFLVHFPASPENDGRVVSAAAHGEIPAGHGELVLIVDDEEGVRNAARLAFESFGYRVLMATDGAEALGVFAQNSDHIALLLVDLMMPIMNGPVLIRALRTIAPDVPIVASTGLVERMQLAELKALGVHTILNKPYRADTLLRTVHAALHPESAANDLQI